MIEENLIVALALIVVVSGVMFFVWFFRRVPDNERYEIIDFEKGNNKTTKKGEKGNETRRS